MDAHDPDLGEQGKRVQVFMFFGKQGTLAFVAVKERRLKSERLLSGGATAHSMRSWRNASQITYVADSLASLNS